MVATRTLNKDILILVKLFLERRNEQLYGSGIADAHELLQLLYREVAPLPCHIYIYSYIAGGILITRGAGSSFLGVGGLSRLSKVKMSLVKRR